MYCKKKVGIQVVPWCASCALLCITGEYMLHYSGAQGSTSCTTHEAQVAPKYTLHCAGGTCCIKEYRLYCNINTSCTTREAQLAVHGSTICCGVKHKHITMQVQVTVHRKHNLQHMGLHCPWWVPLCCSMKHKYVIVETQISSWWGNITSRKEFIKACQYGI